MKDAFFIRMSVHPESKERMFVFEPVLPCTEEQTLDYQMMQKIKSQGVGLYRPATSVMAAYLEFVDNEERVKATIVRKIQECPPDAKWLEENLIGEQPPCKKVDCDGKVITGAFESSTKIGDDE